jgi:hypothetical protein
MEFQDLVKFFPNIHNMIHMALMWKLTDMTTAGHYRIVHRPFRVTPSTIIIPAMRMLQVKPLL